jgi:hypothetical protein
VPVTPENRKKGGKEQGGRRKSGEEQKQEKGLGKASQTFESSIFDEKVEELRFGLGTERARKAERSGSSVECAGITQGGVFVESFDSQTSLEIEGGKAQTDKKQAREKSRSNQPHHK